MRTRLLGAATVAVLAAGALATTGVLGSSHREAPRIMLDPSADNTDVYAFTAPDAPASSRVISNWVPLQNPAGGPYFGKLDPEARYYVKIDNTGDGVEDVAYRWQFQNRFRNPKSFLYAVPPVNSIDDANLNFVQTYDLYYERYSTAGTTSSQRIAHGVPVAPDNVGPKTMPNYAAVAAGAVHGLPGRRQDVRRPGRRPVLRRPRLGLRRHQHRQARPPGDRARQPGRRQGRPRGLQRPLVRAAGPGRRGHARRQGGLRRQGGQRRRRRLVDHRAPGDLGQARLASRSTLGAGQPARQPADQRGRSSRSARRTSTTRRRPPTT